MLGQAARSSCRYRCVAGAASLRNILPLLGGGCNDLELRRVRAFQAVGQRVAVRVRRADRRADARRRRDRSVADGLVEGPRRGEAIRKDRLGGRRSGVGQPRDWQGGRGVSTGAWCRIFLSEPGCAQPQRIGEISWTGRLATLAVLRRRGNLNRNNIYIVVLIVLD